jgi:hypothetical protein
MKRLEEFLRTDPLDAGCGRTMELLDVYAELALSGAEPERRYADIAVHLRGCGPCAEDLRTLLAAVRGHAG